MKHFFIFLILFILCGVLFLAYFLHQGLGVEVALIFFNQQGGKIAEIKTRLARTQAEQINGLMGERQLLENQGMLFIFPDQQTRYFWMRNMLIPLDIIFCDKNKKIVKIEKNAPACLENPCPSYSAETTQYVVEVNAGFAEKYNIIEGDFIKF